MNVLGSLKAYLIELEENYKKTESDFNRVIKDGAKLTPRDSIILKGILREREAEVKIIAEYISNVEDSIDSNLNTVRNWNSEEHLEKVNDWIEKQKKKVYMYEKGDKVK